MSLLVGINLFRWLSLCRKILFHSNFSINVALIQSSDLLEFLFETVFKDTVLCIGFVKVRHSHNTKVRIGQFMWKKRVKVLKLFTIETENLCVMSGCPFLSRSRQSSNSMTLSKYILLYNYLKCFQIVVIVNLWYNCLVQCHSHSLRLLCLPEIISYEKKYMLTCKQTFTFFSLNF